MLNQTFQQGEGILHLAPNWVPRAIWTPGCRLKLHLNDLYAYGANRGGIDERWLSSTTWADNGPLTSPNEGVSRVVNTDPSETQTLLSEAVEELGADLLGDEFWEKFHGWPVFSKFFDNQGPLPHHLHQKPEHAAMVGMHSKPEAYYYPRQMNNYEGDFPYTFFGVEAGTTKEQIRHCLEIWDQGDNHITDYSKAYHLQIGTGWYVPAGVLHAPGSLCTYEPQFSSDISSVFQSMVANVPIPRSDLSKQVPSEKKDDLDFMVSMLDWETNTMPDFAAHYFRHPKPVKPVAVMESEGYLEYWVTYGTEYFAAKELTVLPGRTVSIRDSGPYGMIMIQGHGTMGVWPVETPTMIRFGQLTNDEYFVSCQAAQEGINITNLSKTEPLVMLKHFGPNRESPEA
jgi:hypothetical protein